MLSFFNVYKGHTLQKGLALLGKLGASRNCDFSEFMSTFTIGKCRESFYKTPFKKVATTLAAN